MYCEKCGCKTTRNERICTRCRVESRMASTQNPPYKKWWFWMLMGLVTLLAITTVGLFAGVGDAADWQTSAQEIEYEKVDLRTMFDELDSNALRAEKNYQNKYVEIQGEITDFGSYGSYIRIEPLNSESWNFDTVLCRTKNSEQRNFLLDKKKGDKITIKGQIISVGEYLGYTIRIEEVY